MVILGLTTMMTQPIALPLAHACGVNICLQASWVQRIQECLRNRIKAAKKKLQKRELRERKEACQGAQKNSGHNSRLFRRYPVQQGSSPLDDPHSIDEHCKAMTTEWRKHVLCDQVLLPLLKSTYDSRRMYVEFNEEADVPSTLQVYPAMCHPAAVSGYHWLCVHGCMLSFTHSD